MSEGADDGLWKTLGRVLLSPNLFLIVGAALIALGAAGGITYKGVFPINEHTWRIAIAIGGLVS
jgi:hypothetical protein